MSKIAIAGAGNPAQHEMTVQVETHFTGYNIIDVITAEDVFTCYKAVAQITQSLVKVENRAELIKRTVITDLQTIAIAMPGRIAGHQKILTVLTVVYLFENAPPGSANDPDGSKIV